MDKIFIVAYSTGSHEDYEEHLHFATEDRNKAQEWVDKFNRIVSENEIRIKGKTQGVYNLPAIPNKKPFLFDYICNHPNAFVKEVNKRD